jgi:nitrate/TMAO reductase-like tetraheme cytochrome c subunit
MAEKNEGPGFIRRTWRFMRQPSVRLSAGALLLIGVVAGIGAYLSFMSVVGATNTLAFCTSCHAMEAFVYPDYQASAHYSNASGVQAICSDCHVPKSFFPKMGAKIRATYNELPAALLGRIATEDKFDARKEHLAERVWARMPLLAGNVLGSAVAAGMAPARGRAPGR